MTLLGEKVAALQSTQAAHKQNVQTAEELLLPVGSLDEEYDHIQKLRLEVDILQRLERIENLLGGDRLAAVEAVAEHYIGCKADQIVVRSSDLIRQQPVDLDLLFIALGGKWKEAVETIRADEAERKRLLAAIPYTGRSEAAPILGYRDANGNKIEPQKTE